jgi:hypothetical protein
VAVNDSSEIRTVGISISTREAGGLCDHWDFRPSRTVRFHNRYGWPFLEIRCRPGSVCTTGRPAAPDPVSVLLSCPQVS